MRGGHKQSHVELQNGRQAQPLAPSAPSGLGVAAGRASCGDARHAVNLPPRRAGSSTVLRLKNPPRTPTPRLQAQAGERRERRPCLLLERIGLSGRR